MVEGKNQLQLDDVFVKFFKKDLEKKAEKYMALKELEIRMNKDRESITDYYITVSNIVDYYFDRKQIKPIKNKEIHTTFEQGKTIGMFIDYVMKEFLKAEKFDTDILFQYPINQKHSLIGRVDAIKFINDIVILIEIKYAKNVEKARKRKDYEYAKYVAQLDLYSFMIRNTFKNVRKVYKFIVFTDLHNVAIRDFSNYTALEDKEIENLIHLLRQTLRKNDPHYIAGGDIQ